MLNTVFVRDYTELPALTHFVLEESWVREVQASPGVIVFKVDLTFAASHPEVRPSRAGEMHYGREGEIRFTGVSTLSWMEQGVEPAIDANNETDWGAIDTFTWNGTTYNLSGDFGDIRVEAVALEVVLTGDA